MALLVSTAVLVGCGSASDRSSADPGGVTRVSADYNAGNWGVMVGIRVAFAEDRRVTGARLTWDGGHDDIAPYPLDGTDPDAPLESIDLPAGTGVLLEGSVLAACPEAPPLPVFEVQTVVDGKKVTDRYTPDDPTLFDDAFAEWCQVPFTMTVAGSEVTPGGDYTLWLQLHNPAPYGS